MSALVNGEFFVTPTTSSLQIEQMVDWLRLNRHPFSTLVIDSYTVYHEDLGARWNKTFGEKRKGGAGDKGDFYDFQLGDWQHIKNDQRGFLRKLIELDMNVIVLTREKPEYSEKDGKRERIGNMWDADRSLPYMFDLVLNFTKRVDHNGEVHYEAKKIKGRGPLGERLPDKPFKLTFDMISKLYGGLELVEAEPVEMITDEQQETIAGYLSGIGADDDMQKKLLRRYGVEIVADLSKEDAATIILKIPNPAQAEGAE